MTVLRVLLLMSIALLLFASSPGRAEDPVLVGRLGVGFPGQVVVRDHYAYCTMYDATTWEDPLPLAVIDIADPVHPVVVGTCELPYPYAAVELALSGDRIYLIAHLIDEQQPALKPSSLYSLSISDPTAPVILDRIDFDEPISQLRLSADRLYALGRSLGLVMVGASPSGDLTMLGTFAIPEITEDYPGPWDISGTYAYVTYSSLVPGASGLSMRVVDTSDPAAPVVVADWLLPSPRGPLESLEVEGDRAYVTQYIPDSGFGPWGPFDCVVAVWDLSDPAAPVVLGALVMRDLVARVEARAGSYLYAATFVVAPRPTTTEPPLRAAADQTERTGVWIIDVSDTSAPVKVGECPVPRAMDVWLSGTRAYITGREGPAFSGWPWYGVLRVFDVSNPAAPAQLGEYHTQGYAIDVAVSGSHAFVAAEVAGLQIADASNPAQPKDAGLLTMQGSASAVAGFDHYLLVADVADRATLRVLDISTPTAPVEVGNWPPGAEGLEGSIHEIVVAGSYAYVSAYLNQGSTLYILDLSTPSAPATAGSLVHHPTAADPWVKVPAVAGGYAYVISPWESEFRIVDVSEPSAPRVVGSCALSAQPWGAAVSGHYAYVATLEEGLSVVDVADPNAPVEVATLDIGGCADAVAVVGTYALLTKSNATYVDGDTFLPSMGALLLMDISNPLAPKEVGRYEQRGPVGAIATSDNYIYACEHGRGLLVLRFRLHDYFLDVNRQHWAYAEISACFEAGIVSGYADGCYHPEVSVTRDQMAAYISRALAHGDANVPNGPQQASFPDVPGDHWAYRYVEYAKAGDMVQGYPDGTYRPALELDRGQMAVYIARALAGGEAQVPPGPPIPTFPDVRPSFWAYKHVEYIADPERAVAEGYRDGLYHPAYICTRDQMAVFVARAFRLEM